MKSEAKLIGLTGTNASGKGEAAVFFQTHGFAYFSLSDVIRDELRNQGLLINRDNLIRTGNELREEFGPDILARRIMEKIERSSIIDSIRNPHEIRYLRSQGRFLLLAIDAPLEVRFTRAQRRGRDESAATLGEFAAKENQEKTRDARAQQLETCMEMADHLILNQGTLEEFRHKLEAFV